MLLFFPLGLGIEEEGGYGAWRVMVGDYAYDSLCRTKPYGPYNEFFGVLVYGLGGVVG